MRCSARNVLLVAALAGSALAVAAPRGGGVDLTALPPLGAEIERSLKDAGVSLEDAIAAARGRVPGVVESAVYHHTETPPSIEVVVYADGAGQRVTVDAASGEVSGVSEVSRFPGLPASGDWTETDSGVMYYEIESGSGPALADDSALKMRFNIMLMDGTSLMNTLDEGEPQVHLRSSLMVPGWQSGVEGMTAGSTRKLIIPGALAFGDRAQGQVPANAMLVVDMKLLEVDPYTAVPEPLPGAPVDGVAVTTPSGLQYYDIVVGDGPMPAGPNTVVKVHYTGWLNDGTLFDSSVERGEPVDFPLNRVIPGWTEGVGSMHVGGKRKLIIPYELAYGAAGRQGAIPPKALLTFDVELLEIVKE